MDHLLRNSGNRDWWGDLVAPPPNQRFSNIFISMHKSTQKGIIIALDSFFCRIYIYKTNPKEDDATTDRCHTNADNDDCGFCRCTGGDDDGVTQADVDTAREEGRLAGIAEATPVSTLDTIMSRNNGEGS